MASGLDRTNACNLCPFDLLYGIYENLSPYGRAGRFSPMCGIVGILNLSGAPVDEDTVRKMCAVLVHRGPDDEGVYIADSIGLGHRRLSVIDLVSGHQPLGNKEKTIWISYNGEVYNYAELR